MDAKDYQKMLEDKKEHNKEMRAARSEARDDKKETKDKALEAPKKNKMVEAPQKKKTVGKSKSEPAEPAMRWRK